MYKLICLVSKVFTPPLHHSTIHVLGFSSIQEDDDDDDVHIGFPESHTNHRFQHFIHPST
jgi:hypothetical protein